MSAVQLFCKKIIDNMVGDSTEEKLKYVMNLIETEYNSIEKPERAIIKPDESKCIIISEKVYTIPDIITTNCYCRLNSKGFPSQCKSQKVPGEKMCKRHLKMYKDTDIIHGEGMIDEDMPMKHLPGSKKEGKNHCWKCTSDGTIIEKKKKETSIDKPKRKQKKCGNCGEYGHMKKTCKVNMNITKIPMKTKVVKSTIDEPTNDESTNDESTNDESTNDESTNDETTVDETTVDETTVDETKVIETTEDDIELEKALNAITQTSAVVDKSDGIDYPQVKFNTSINMYKSSNNDDNDEENDDTSEIDDLDIDEENYGFTINGVKYEFEINEDGEKLVINDEYEPVGIWNGEKSCIEWDCEEYEIAHKNHEDYISS